MANIEIAVNDPGINIAPTKGSHVAADTFKSLKVIYGSNDALTTGGLATCIAGVLCVELPNVGFVFSLCHWMSMNKGLILGKMYQDLNTVADKKFKINELNFFLFTGGSTVDKDINEFKNLPIASKAECFKICDDARGEKASKYSSNLDKSKSQSKLAKGIVGLRVRLIKRKLVLHYIAENKK